MAERWEKAQRDANASAKARQVDSKCELSVVSALLHQIWMSCPVASDLDFSSLAGLDDVAGEHRERRAKKGYEIVVHFIKTHAHMHSSNIRPILRSCSQAFKKADR
jgi:hypothetical protein